MEDYPKKFKLKVLGSILFISLLSIFGTVQAAGDDVPVEVEKLTAHGKVDARMDKNKSKSMAERPNENYFSTWLQLKEIRRFDRIKDFLKKLTEEENVLAVKQAYIWLIEQERQSSGKKHEGVAFRAIGDFTYNYFKGDPNRDPKPFLEMIEDSSQDNRFRLRLIKCFGRKYDKEPPYLQAACDSLIKMISNASEPLELRQQAKSTVSSLLGHQYHRVRKSQDELRELSMKELLSFPKEKVSAETQKRIKVLADNYNRYFWVVLSLPARDLTLYDRLFNSEWLLRQKKDGLVTDPALVEALDNTVKKLTLSKDEFIKGAKQANEWISKEKRQTEEVPDCIGWEGMAIYTAGGFVQYYFRRFPGESPKPFLEMAADKNNDEDFRKAMLDMLEDNDFYTLKQAHLDTFSSSLISIAGDEGNSILIRKEALDCLQGQLGSLKTTEKENELLFQNIKATKDKYIQTLLHLLKESNLEPGLMRHVLRDLNAYLEKQTKSAPQIREALENAVRNYHKFNEEQWSHLAKIGVKTLNLPDVDDLLESMVKDIDKIIAVQQDVKKKRKLESDRKFINVKLLGNLSKQQRKQLVINIGITEEALVEANRIVANPRSEKDRLHWEARVKDLEKQLEELKEILRRGKVRYLKGIPEQEPDISRKKQIYEQFIKLDTKKQRSFIAKLNADDMHLFTLGLVEHISRTTGLSSKQKGSQYKESLALLTGDSFEKWGEKLLLEKRPLSASSIISYLENTNKPLSWKMAFRGYLEIIFKQKKPTDAYEIGLTDKDIDILKRYFTKNKSNIPDNLGSGKLDVMKLRKIALEVKNSSGT